MLYIYASFLFLIRFPLFSSISYKKNCFNPSYFISDAIFIPLVDKFKKVYLTSRLSQSARHTSYLSVDKIFYPSRRLVRKLYICTHVYVKAPCMFKFTQYVLFPIWFSFFSPINLENIFQPHLFKRHPSRFMSIRHFLYPKRSLPFSSISLKNYIPPHVYFNAPVMFYIYPSFFVSDSIFTLFVDELTKLYMNPNLSQSAHHVL